MDDSLFDAAESTPEPVVIGRLDVASTPETKERGVEKRNRRTEVGPRWGRSVLDLRFFRLRHEEKRRKPPNISRGE